ncbi:hypothetical protein [Azospirillum sp. B2RO_4]|uniref:hypothetical protein n=1 Tax=Azospirillum sp. B2RO_4 TaxID=3027796 RepID=UPI003DA8398E
MSDESKKSSAELEAELRKELWEAKRFFLEDYAKSMREKESSRSLFWQNSFKTTFIMNGAGVVSLLTFSASLIKDHSVNVSVISHSLTLSMQLFCWGCVIVALATFFAWISHQTSTERYKNLMEKALRAKDFSEIEKIHTEYCKGLDDGVSNRSGIIMMVTLIFQFVPILLFGFGAYSATDVFVLLGSVK